MMFKTKKTSAPRMIDWRDGALRVREPAPQPRKRKVNWLRIGLLASAWLGLIVGLGLFMWLFMYGLVVLLH
jgi:hypothetical protein